LIHDLGKKRSSWNEFIQKMWNVPLAVGCERFLIARAPAERNDDNLPGRLRSHRSQWNERGQSASHAEFGRRTQEFAPAVRNGFRGLPRADVGSSHWL
jgi:hypothetical protein